MNKNKSSFGHFTGWQTPTVNENICAGERCYSDAERGQNLCAKCKKRRAGKRLISQPGYHWIYLAESEGKVKIGHATNLKLSLGSLKEACPSEVRLLMAFEGDKEMAAGLRDSFADCRSGGRWFAYCDDMEALLGIVKKRGIKTIYPDATGRVLYPADIVDTA